MKFGRIPDGKGFFGYSTISDSFYALYLNNEDLLREVIADCAGDIARRYMDILQGDGLPIDVAIRDFRYSDDERKSRNFWRDYFRRCGCSPEQLAAVELRLEELAADGDLLGEEPKCRDT